MTRRAPVGSILWSSDSGSGGAKGPEFVQCVNGQYPQIHKVWAFGSNGIMCEVHPTARVDVGSVVVGEFLSDYITGSGHRIPIIGQISINGSVEYLGITDLHRTSGPFCDANLLAPCSSWGEGGTTTNQNWVVQHGGLFGIVSVLWSRPFSVHLAYVLRCCLSRPLGSPSA